MIVATSKKRVTEEEMELLLVLAAEAAASLWRIDLTNRNITELKEFRVNGVVRTSLHYYNTEEELKKLFGTVRELAKRGAYLS